MEKDETKKVNQGAFMDSLKRNNKQIREDRAEAIGEDAEMAYKHSLDDLNMQLKRRKRERENMLDMSPTNSQSLMVANDFDAKLFVEKDMEIGIEIWKLEQKIELSEKQYEKLFGKRG